MLNKPGKKAGLAILREVSIGRYVFSKSLREMGTVSMSKLTDVPQPVQFKVIRHGPPPMLIHFSTTYKEYPAEDANVIGVDLARPTAVHAPSGGVTLRMQEIGKGSMEGLLLLRIENASRAAIEEMKIMKWSKERPAEKPAEWSMTVDGNGRFMLASAADEFVSCAPGGVYDERITWNRTVTQNQGGGISQCFYAKDGITGRYSWLKIAVGLRYKKMLDVYIEGLTNPEGSTNLYEDVWPDKEAFDRYVRSCP